MAKKLYRPNWKEAVIPYIVAWIAVCAVTIYTIYELSHRTQFIAAANLNTPAIQQNSTEVQHISAPPIVRTEVQIIKK